MGPPTSLSLTTPLPRLPGMGTILAQKFARLGIATAGDLLFYFPRRWDDFSSPRPIASLTSGETATVRATILQIQTTRSPKKRIFVTTALLQDESGAIKAVWFNQPYLTRLFRPKTTWIFTGKAVRSPRGIILESPQYERQPGIFPVYPETAGVSSKMIRRHVRTVLPLAKTIAEYLPDAVLTDEKLMGISSSLRSIHFPETPEAAEQAKERLAFDELFFLALRMLVLKKEIHQAQAPPMKINEGLLKRFADALPFKLTNAQRKAAWEIVQDLAKPTPMNRLLEGDVGSGKTVTAMFGVLTAVDNGLQVVWMAPTEILALQHYQTTRDLAKSFNLRVGIITGAKKENRDADLTIGTHALLTEGVTFPRLGLLIVDEQHRFGVKQRAQLREGHDLVPHLLSMTATPIPRTLALAIYGDLDLSILDESPSGRQLIKTSVVPPSGRENAYRFIREQIREGRQAFVITPLIEPQKMTSFAEIEQKSAIAEYEKLKKSVFPEFKIGLLHGKLKPKDKQAVMERFAAGKLDILVSTAVVEVGIDVPNATVMMIEGAERFGLAQLHQLRGRVGRREHPSYCFCFAESWSATTKKRLKAFLTAKNGFELAELDLQLRGPGELAGVRQAGLPDLKMASLSDSFMIQRARRAAEKIIEEGIDRYPQLSTKLKEFIGARHLE